MSNIKVLGAFVSMSCLVACGGGSGSGADPGTDTDAGSGGSPAEASGGMSSATGGTSNGSGGTPAISTGGMSNGTGGMSNGTGGTSNATGGTSNGTGGTEPGDDGGAGPDAEAEGDAAPSNDGGACPEGYTGENCGDCAVGYVEDGTVCAPACSVADCGNGTCSLDATSRPVCDCAVGWSGAACDECAAGYRFAPVLIGDPPVCELDEPETTNMALWLDAQRDVSFQFGTANTVVRWYSRVPGDTTYFSDGGVASARPTRTLSRVGGRYWVTFDGVDDRLRRLVDLQSDSYSVYLAIRVSSTKLVQTILSGVQSGSLSHGLMLQAQDYGDTLFFRHRSPFGGAVMDDVTQSNFAMTEPRIIEIHRAFSSGTSLYSVYDGSTYQGTMGSAVAFDAELLLHLGIRGDSNTFPLEGSIGEVVMYAPMLPLNQRQDVREYLAAKWVE